MKPSEIFDMGYALMVFDIRQDIDTFRFKDEEINVKHGSVKTSAVPGIQFEVAKVEDVRSACLIQQ